MNKKNREKLYRETKKVLKVKLGQPAFKNRQVKGKEKPWKDFLEHSQTQEQRE